MPDPQRYRRARLVQRYKRFLADVELDSGETLTVHCPNPGRMIGVKDPGSEVCLRDSANPRRKLRWTLQSIRVGEVWVHLDTLAANPFIEARLRSGELPELGGYDRIERERPYGKGSRIDLLLSEGAGPEAYVEIKSTTYLDDDVARFPDAVTARGTRHLRELMAVRAAGKRAVMLFLVCREDATRFAPADAIDPVYCAALREAAEAGVELLAYAARGGPEELELLGPLPIDLSPPVPTA